MFVLYLWRGVCIVFVSCDWRPVRVSPCLLFAGMAPFSNVPNWHSSGLIYQSLLFVFLFSSFLFLYFYCDCIIFVPFSNDTNWYNSGLIYQPPFDYHLLCFPFQTIQSSTSTHSQLRQSSLSANIHYSCYEIKQQQKDHLMISGKCTSILIMIAVKSALTKFRCM